MANPISEQNSIQVDSLRRHYENPPLIEALCELTFSEKESDPTLWGVFYDKIRHKYPLKQQVQRVNVQIPAQLGLLPQTLDLMMRFSKEDGSRLVQVSGNLLAINHLKPYSTFETFLADIGEATDIFKQIVLPDSFQRIAVRYINKFDLPTDNLELSEYFNLGPAIPESVATSFNEILMRLGIPSPIDGHQLFVTLNSGLTTNESTAFILDLLDVYAKPNDVNISFILERVAEAHDNIGRLFENIITDKARLIFGEKKNDTQ